MKHWSLTLLTLALFSLSAPNASASQPQRLTFLVSHRTAVKDFLFLFRDFAAQVKKAS